MNVATCGSPGLIGGRAVDRSRASPNFGARAQEIASPDMIVLHYTGMRDGPAAIDWLCDPASQVSCHYVVTDDGGILQLVAEDARAWHAGRSFWAGVTDVNSASIGIEIVNGGHDFGLPPYPDSQIAAVIDLCRDIMDRRGIRRERVLAHSDIAPARKRDPGERFPWRQLAKSGVGCWVDCDAALPGDRLEAGSTGEAVLEVQRWLAAYGYGVATTGVFDPATETVVRAFQRHFRPGLVDGRADQQTCVLARSLVELASRPSGA